MASLVFAAACAGAPSERELRSTAETAASWAASVRFAVQAWGQGRVTRPYLRTALEQARQALDEEARPLRGQPSLPGRDVARAAALLDREAALAATLAGDVERKDESAAQVHAGELETVERELRGLAAALGS